MIRIKNLTKSYGDKVILNDLDFHVKKGTIHALLGVNGAGKTTLINILSGVKSFESGTILVNGYPLKEKRKIKSILGLTGQFAAVDEKLTGYENLMLVGRLYQLKKKDAENQAHKLLEQFDLVDAARKIAGNYSGGMKRRLDLAMSLMNDPKLIILDEPTTGLDPDIRRQLWDYVLKLKNNGTTILLTTQYLEEAEYLADVVSILNDGRIIKEAKPEALKKEYAQQLISFTTNKILPQGETRYHWDGRKYSIQTKNILETLKDLIELLKKLDIKVQDLSVQNTSLEEIFIGLTQGVAK